MYGFVSLIDKTNVSEPIGPVTISSVNVRVGSIVSMITLVASGAELPAGSVCDAVNVTGPSLSPENTTDQFPLALINPV